MVEHHAVEGEEPSVTLDAFLDQSNATAVRLEPDDDARAFAAGNQRQTVRRRIKARAVIDVDEVEADRGLADQHLPQTWGAGINILIR